MQLLPLLLTYPKLWGTPLTPLLLLFSFPLLLCGLPFLSLRDEVGLDGAGGGGGGEPTPGESVYLKIGNRLYFDISIEITSLILFKKHFFRLYYLNVV